MTISVTRSTYVASYCVFTTFILNFFFCIFVTLKLPRSSEQSHSVHCTDGFSDRIHASHPGPAKNTKSGRGKILFHSTVQNLYPDNKGQNRNRINVALNIMQSQGVAGGTGVCLAEPSCICNINAHLQASLNEH